jgi:broad specificity phosphatase PhoE
VTVRLTLISHAPTLATHSARFAADEGLSRSGPLDVAPGVFKRVDETYCGPERRCAETADALGLPAVVDPALRDLDIGGWHGRTLDDVEQADADGLNAWLTNPAAVPHGGESLVGLLDRVGDWLSLPRTENARIVAITHPSIVRAVLVRILRAPAESFWLMDVTPLSQTRLTGAGGRWTLRETGHPITS